LVAGPFHTINQGKGLIDVQRQSQQGAKALSDNQTTAAIKYLAKLCASDNHNPATGRRFKVRTPPPFSSRLSRNIVG